MPTHADIIWLQWGQRLSALDTVHNPLRMRSISFASMGPTPFSVGYRHVGRDRSSPERNDHASMGPTPFSVGYSTAPPAPPVRRKRLNGANAFQRWIPTFLIPAFAGMTFASMGPTPFSVGYIKTYSLDPRNFYAPQWGQRLSALDTCSRRQTRARRQPPQWGQRLSALDTAFSPRFSLIIPLFGGECRHFARRSFFWLPNRDGFRPSEPIFDRFFANAPSWAVRRRSVRSAVLTMSWISRARAAGRIRLSRNGARRVMRGGSAAAPGSARASGGFRILGRPGRRARPARSC